MIKSQSRLQTFTWVKTLVVKRQTNNWKFTQEVLRTNILTCLTVRTEYKPNVTEDDEEERCVFCSSF